MTAARAGAEAEPLSAVAVALGRLNMALTALGPLVSGAERRVAHGIVLTLAAEHARSRSRYDVARALDAQRRWLWAAHDFARAGAEFAHEVQQVRVEPAVPGHHGAPDVLDQLGALLRVAERIDAERGGS